MSTSDRLTIVVPTRDRVAYLRECLQSVLAQTYRDFRVVVLDNASSQDVRAAIAPLADERVSLLRSDTSRDVIGSLNAALRITTTPYFMVFHDDDTMHPRLLETEMRLLAEDSRLAFVAACCVEVRDDAAMPVFGEIQPSWERYADDRELVRAFVRGSWLHLGSVIYDRRATEGLALDGERYWVLADRPFLAAVTGSRPSACLLGPWLHWRKHPGATGSGLAARHVFELLDFYRGVLSRDGWDRGTRDLFLRFATDSLLGSYPRLARPERPPIHRYVGAGIARGFLHPLAVRPAVLGGLARAMIAEALRGASRAPGARRLAWPVHVGKTSGPTERR